AFFVQAEDGIRDLIVTGVQTCAFRSWCLKLAAARSVMSSVMKNVARQRPPGFKSRPTSVVMSWNRSGRRCVNTESSTATSKLARSEEHTSELQSRSDLVCRLLLEKKK